MMETQRNNKETMRIGVLDGVRVLAIGIVVWFHFWQLSWLSPEGTNWSMTFLPRFGYLMVDMMILLSGFCLFLPYAREAVYGAGASSVKINVRDFYIKRLARIAPCYYVVIFVILLLIEIPEGSYEGASVMKDLGPHLVFLHNLFPVSYLGTHLDIALWTVAVIVQLYALFPLFARCFLKKPLVTYLVMTGISLVSTWFIVYNPAITNDNTLVPMLVNNTVSFIAVYANGMLGAWGYMQLKKCMDSYFGSGTSDPEKKRNKSMIGILAVVLAIGCMLIYRVICFQHAVVVGQGSGQVWQLENRYMLSLLFLFFILCLLFSARGFQKIFDNRVVRFLSGISFNYYMVHQYIAAKLRDWDIPEMDGENPREAGSAWQWEFLLLSIVISFVFAIILTYVVEKPCAKWIRKHFIDKRKKIKKR